MTVNDQQLRLDALLQPLPFSVTLFPPPSRYAGIPTAVLDPDGDRPIIYLGRRFVPHPERLAEIGAHTVVAGERPDNIAAAAFGDPELFWRLCDANRAIVPAELVREIGRRLRITLPEALAGPDGGRP